jgi:hypothetical protein
MVCAGDDGFSDRKGSEGWSKGCKDCAGSKDITDRIINNTDNLFIIFEYMCWLATVAVSLLARGFARSDSFDTDPGKRLI